MPVIPGINEGQILNAGSPVPIAAPEENRLAGNTIARAGEAMFALGDALDSAAQKEKQKRDILTEQIAQQEARKAILEETAVSEQAAPIEGDQTGFGQAKAFYERMQPRVNEIAQSITDPETRRGFLARIGDTLNDSAKEIYAKEIVKRKDQNNALQDQVISGYGQIARMDPKETPFMLGQAELSVRKNPDIPDSMKEEAVLSAKKKVLTDAINGMSARGNYSTAEVSLEQYGGGIFSPAEKDKMLNDIRDTQYKDNNRAVMELTRQEKNMEKAKAQKEQNLTNYYFSALQLAGVDENKRAPILLQIGQDVVKGNLKEEKAAALIGTKVFSRPVDDLYDAQVMKKVFDTQDYQSAIDQVYADRGTKVSPERASDMINRIGAIEEHKKNDPNFIARVKAGERKIRDQGADSILAPMDNLSKREFLTKIDQTVEQYYKQIRDNPKLDTAEVSNTLIQENLGLRTTFFKGHENFLNYNSMEGLTKERDRIVQETLAKKNKGLLTPDIEQSAKDELQKIQKRMNELKPVEAGPTPAIQPNTLPARGR